MPIFNHRPSATILQTSASRAVLIGSISVNETHAEVNAKAIPSVTKGESNAGAAYVYMHMNSPNRASDEAPNLILKIHSTTDQSECS